MELAKGVLYLPFVNAVIYGLYYALLQEVYGVVSLATILVINGVLFLASGCAVQLFGRDRVSLAPLGESRTFWILVAVVGISTVLQATHYLAMRYTSATYMAFAEVGYPLFVPLFGYFLFARGGLNWSITCGGTLVILGSLIIARGGFDS